METSKWAKILKKKLKSREIENDAPGSLDEISNAEGAEAPKADVEPRKEPSVEKENGAEAAAQPMDVVEAGNEGAPLEEAEPKPANDAEERPQEEEAQPNNANAAPAPVPVPNVAPVAAVPPPAPAVHNLPPLQLRQVTEAELRHSEEMPDAERNERWRSMRPYTYPNHEEGPAQGHRKSLLQLLDAVANELGEPLDKVLRTPEGRMKVNEFIKGETAYVPEMLHYVTLDHVAGQDAHDYLLRPSRGKPPFNVNESSIAVIFERKSMPLRHAELNMIVTSFGSWPAERIFLNEFAILKKNVKKVEDWRTVRFERKRGHQDEVQCLKCGYLNKIGPRY